MTSIAPNIWPPNYVAQFVSRYNRVKQMKENPVLIVGAKEYYSHPENWVEFIEHWMVTSDPRNRKYKDKPIITPFILFPKQKEFVQFIIGCWLDGESGLIEKSRDMGATWLSCCISVCMWLFVEGSSIGWGSRGSDLVDNIGDPSSIFEKMRILIRYLPKFFLPIGFSERNHSHSMRLVNPENGSTITGEIGDNIGRGGRTSIYFKDESAHYQHPEMIEAALGDNTDVQIDMSSVNGTANVFARKRFAGEVWLPGKKIESGMTRVFILDWRDHPEKTQEWHDKRYAKYEREGLLRLFSQEVLRDYSAAVEGILIPAQWVQSAVDLDKRFPKFAALMRQGQIFSGLDVADEGGDLNSQADRKGITLIGLDKWAQGDTGETANKAVMRCKIIRASELFYDCVGVGSGVKAETNRLKRENLLPANLKITPWNGGDSVLNPDGHSIPDDNESPLNKDLYKNLKAQGWWNLRTRFEKTWRFVTKGTQYPMSELINIPSDILHFNELIAELSQPTYGSTTDGKIIVDKKPDGTRSPNLADSVNIVYWPWTANKQAGVWGK